MEGNAANGRHMVLAQADGGAYRSLRQRPVTRVERYALGKSLRKRRSVLGRYLHSESAWHAHQGQWVVEYQQSLQTVSDPLLAGPPWTD